MNASALRVLVIDDSTIIRARLSEAIGEIPNVTIVGEADTEAGALAKLGGDGWDVAVLDLQLRQGTGLGVLKALRANGRPAHTRIIIFTNYALPQYRQRSLLLGADFFFDKTREFHRVREVLSMLADRDPPPAAAS